MATLIWRHFVCIWSTLHHLQENLANVRLGSLQYGLWRLSKYFFSTKLFHTFYHGMTLYIALSWLSSSNIIVYLHSHFQSIPSSLSLCWSQSVSVQHQMTPDFLMTGISEQITLCFISGSKEDLLGSIWKKRLPLYKHILH